MPQEGGWRSRAAYDYIDDLSPSDLAWEFLRRNDSYRKDYASLSRDGQIDGREAAALAERWGLAFRYGSDAQRAGHTYLLDPDRRSGIHTPRTLSCRLCRRSLY